MWAAKAACVLAVNEVTCGVVTKEDGLSNREQHVAPIKANRG